MDDHEKRTFTRPGVQVRVSDDYRPRLEGLADNASRRAGFDRRVISIAEIVRQAIALGIEELERREREEATRAQEPAQG